MARPYYAMMLDVSTLRVLMVGGGSVAARRLGDLTACGARPAIIAPELCETMRELIEANRLPLQLRRYEGTDVEGRDVVFAATNDRSVNAQIANDAARVRCLVNVCDHSDEGNFILPAVYRSRNLTIGVSTNGASPTLAVGLRDELAASYGDWVDAWIEKVGAARVAVRGAVKDEGQRRKIMRRIASDEVRALYRAGEYAGAEERIAAILREETMPS